MSLIKLSTEINAPLAQCFDLARSIDFHIQTGVSTKEEAIAGKTSGLIGLGEEVTFRARHFGITQSLTSRITEYEHGSYFTDEMVKGAFKSLKHRHSFRQQGNITVMEDDFCYEAPFGLLGRLFDKIILRKHMKNFLKERNSQLKNALEKREIT
jgi:ligand-binding SRPBCC domain-containing protein